MVAHQTLYLNKVKCCLFFGKLENHFAKISNSELIFYIQYDCSNLIGMMAVSLTQHFILCLLSQQKLQFTNVMKTYVLHRSRYRSTWKTFETSAVDDRMVRGSPIVKNFGNAESTLIGASLKQNRDSAVSAVCSRQIFMGSNFMEHETQMTLLDNFLFNPKTRRKSVILSLQWLLREWASPHLQMIFLGDFSIRQRIISAVVFILQQSHSIPLNSEDLQARHVWIWLLAY